MGEMGWKEKLAAGRFLITAEVTPPRGTDAGEMIRFAASWKGLVDAVNVTDSPLATVRMSSFIAAHLLEREAGVEAIFHYTCRDRNVIALQGDLLGSWALGLKNILALGGDAPERARGVYEVDSLGLVRLVEKLNRGESWEGEPLRGATGFTVGVGADPLAPDLAREAYRVGRKVEAGASFVQTQPVFDPRAAEEFLAALEAEGVKVPVLFGVLPLTGSAQAKRMAAIPGIRLPERVLRAVEEGGERAGLDLAGRLVRELRLFASGVHLFPLGRPALVPRVLEIAAG